MNVIVQIIVGALTGWLAGKAVEVEGRITVVREGHVTDVIYGIIGALIGNIYFSDRYRSRQPSVVMQPPFFPSLSLNRSTANPVAPCQILNDYKKETERVQKRENEA
jgi:uncharacterized membrane protein YeaQ/YmgE (transglycosylase-associated protein family)